MLDRPGSPGFMCFIIYDGGGLRVQFEGGRSHQGAQYYLSVRRVEQPLSGFGVDLSLLLPTTVATLTQVKHFVMCSTFSVFYYQKNFQSVFWISEKECIYTVKCCDLVFFLNTLDINLTQLLLLSL